MLGLGMMGIFLPILPTTPFVLVAAACFAGTPALHSHVTKIPFVNEYITNYKTGTGLPRRTVAVSLSFLWITLIVSALLGRKLWIVLLLAVVGVAVTVHIVMTARPRAKQKSETDNAS